MSNGSYNINIKQEYVGEFNCNVSPALAAISTDLLAAIALSSMLSAIPLTTFTSSET